MVIKEYTSIKLKNYIITKLDRVLNQINISRQNYINTILERFTENELKELYLKAIKKNKGGQK